jgi:hypothetical protein
MAKQTINIGAAPNDGTGTPLRTSFDYCNQNFTELYTATGPSGNNIVVPGSATITGDLTVRTNKLAVTSTGVGIGTTTPTAGILLDVVGGTFARFNKGAANQYHLRIGNSAKDYGLYVDIDNNGTNGFAFYDITAAADVMRYIPGASGSWTHYINGTTAMTLNSTGLGVGGAPSDGRLLTIGSLSSVSATANAINIYSSKATLNITADGATNAAGTTISYSWANGGQGPLIFRNASIANVMTLDATGNVGVGVTPKTWVTNRGGIEVAGKAAAFLALNGTGNVSEMFFNSYYDSTGPAYKYAYDGLGGRHEFGSAGWSWLIAPTNSSGAGATASTWTQAMTLDASGNLILQSSATPATLITNGQLTVNATSNTNLRFSYRGSDGTTRVANITLA